MREIQKLIELYVSDRPVMMENNLVPANSLKLIKDELQEMEEAMGDKNSLGREIADVAWMLLSFANIHGIDVEEEIRTKMARNYLKRPAYLWQDGTYEECDKKARSEWTKQIEEEFYSL